MSPIVRVRHELRARRLTVEQIIELSPTMRRFIFTGETEGFPHVDFAPTEHVRVLLPDADGSLRVPVVGDGPPQFSGERPTMRDYTPRAVDAEGRIVIDMITAHDGPAARWARMAAPGAQLALLGPRGSAVMPEVSHYALLADESALPALSRWLEEAPASAQIDAVILVEERSRFDLLERPNTTVRWVNDGPAALEALATITLRSDSFVWAAGEAGLLKQVRDLLTARQVARENRQIDGYWRAGEANFDHHTALDPAE